MIVSDFRVKKLIDHLEPGRRYLIQFWHGWGDVVMFMPLLERLRQLRPDCSIDISLCPGRGQESIITEAVPFEPEKYDLTFCLTWPMETATRTKQEMGCIHELGIEPSSDHYRPAPQESPLVLVHFQSGSCPAATCPEGVARRIWNEIEQAGCIPYEVQFACYVSAGRHVRWDFIKASARDVSPQASTLRSLVGLMQRARAFVGVVSGPLNTAIGIIPERTMCLNVHLRVSGVTRRPIASCDVSQYRDGTVYAWLTGAPLAPGRMIMDLYGSRMQRRRNEGWAVIFSELDRRGLKTMVETGTTRQAEDWGAGMATKLLGEYCQRVDGARLTTVDVNARALDVARQVTCHCREVIDYSQADAVEYLGRVDGTLDFVYLDSMDYEPGIERQSQEQCLRESRAAEPRMSPAGIIAIDDCDLPGGGKGKLAVEWLLSKGWKTLHRGYMTVMGRAEWPSSGEVT